MKTIALSFAVLLILFIALPAAAQTRELQGASHGRGLLKFEGQGDKNLREASVFLRRGGVLEIRLSGYRANDPYLFTGRWFAGRNGTYEFELTGGFGDAGAHGKGSVTLRPGGQIEHLEFSGYSKRQAFSAYFDYEDANLGLPDEPDIRNSGYVGTYRSSERTQSGNREFTIIRVLRLHEDGNAELVSRYKGSEPVVNRETLTRHGNLLTDIRDRRSVMHIGTWRNAPRGGIEVALKALDPQGRNDSAPATLRLEFRGNDHDNLVMTGWDRQLYGNAAFQFARTSGDEGDDTDQRPANEEPRTAPGSLSLSDQGEGSLSVGRGPKKPIYAVRINSIPNDRVEISLEHENAVFTTFTGRIVNRDRGVFTVRLADKGSMNASGTFTIEAGSGGKIRRLSGNGLLDGKSLTVEFTGARGADRDTTADRDTSASGREGINISQTGNGLWTRERFPNLSVESVTVITRSGGDADISLRFSGGQRLVLSGRVETRNANGLVIRLTQSGNLNASGTVNVEYGRNNSIETLSGEGRLDNSRFTVQFSRR
jgi:hypothetical protein